MSNVAITVEGLSKRYRIGARQQGYKTLRERLNDLALQPFRAASPGTGAKGSGAPSENPQPAIRNPKSETIWALKDVSFEVKRGEVVGIIGGNGAGKSTLLKVLSRITEPTAGAVDLYGRVGSLLEVGTGFHPELTGRENIFLNGAILGMRKAEIARKFDEIVAFAETEKFIDTPVKYYSSGMYVRLAFAVAAHMETDILLVDEVLAVGDAAFQKKCLGKMGDVAKEGRSILFVSHNMQAITNLCSHGLLLEHGVVAGDGSIASCVSTYLNEVSRGGTSHWSRSELSDDAQQLRIETIHARLLGDQPNIVLRITTALRSLRSHKRAFMAIDISDLSGTVLMQALPSTKGFIGCEVLNHKIEVDIDLPPMVPGTYLVTVWVGAHNTETLDYVRQAVSFDITNSPTPWRTFPHTPDHGSIVPQSRFNYRDADSAVQLAVSQ